MHKYQSSTFTRSLFKCCIALRSQPELKTSSTVPITYTSTVYTMDYTSIILVSATVHVPMLRLTGQKKEEPMNNL